MKKKSDIFTEADAALDKIQGDKHGTRYDRMEAIDAISNEIGAITQDSTQRTRIIKRCCVLARQIEFKDQPNLI